MSLRELSIAGAYLSRHQVFPDKRGLFREWFKADEIEAIKEKFVVRQANFSKSFHGVIRGIHYSLASEGQDKVVSCTSGQILDVLVDLRLGSPSFMQVARVTLTEDSGDVIYVPSGVGHGFSVLSETGTVTYLLSSPYSPDFEHSINPLDPNLGIDWGLPHSVTPIISPQDEFAPNLDEAFRTNKLPRYQSRSSPENCD